MALYNATTNISPSDITPSDTTPSDTTLIIMCLQAGRASHNQMPPEGA
jgi:hypothetical protein